MEKRAISRRARRSSASGTYSTKLACPRMARCSLRFPPSPRLTRAACRSRITRALRTSSQSASKATYSGVTTMLSASLYASRSGAFARPLVTHVYAKTARSADQRIVRIERARADRDFGQRHVDHAALAPGHHAAEPTLRDDFDGVHAKRGGEQAVAGRRRAATLHVSEDCHANVDRDPLRQPFRKIVPDSTVMRVTRRVGDGSVLAVLRPDAFRDDDQRMCATGSE